jgi:hypothetical protein
VIADIAERVSSFITSGYVLQERAVIAMVADGVRLSDMERRVHVAGWPLTDGACVDTEIAVCGHVRWTLIVVRDGSSVEWRERWS